MSADVLVIGGGLAGSAAAITLSRGGRRVTLLEKESLPQHKVCGEFLSQEALGYLRMLGVDAASLGAVPIHSVRLAGVTYPLPFAAMSLTRRRLDEELLRLAAEAGANVLRGCRVRMLERTGEGWQAKYQNSCGEETEFETADVFLATGKHDLFGRPRPKGKQTDLLAFKMYFRLSPAQATELQGHVELVLYRGGYAGLQMVEDNAANLCCLIQRRDLQRMGGHWENLLDRMQRDCLLLRERLHGAEPLLPKPLAISAIPYGYVRDEEERNLWVPGDQAAVIPSFTGDGMSIALHSGCLAAAMYLCGDSAEDFQHRLHLDLKHQVSLATMLSKGLVSRPCRSAMVAAVKMWPGLIGTFASRTRISQGAIASMLSGYKHSASHSF